MNGNKKVGSENRGNASHSSATEKETTLTGSNSVSPDVTGILDERIYNLREAIQEIDAALAHRKVLNIRFLEQIDREAEEVKRHLNMLQEPWKMGFHPDVEFLRLSFHKSLTSRAKESRSEQLKYWENNVNLAKERRKFLDEYKELLAAKKRLMQP
jgi:hypothetical protein